MESSSDTRGFFTCLMCRGLTKIDYLKSQEWEQAQYTDGERYFNQVCLFCQSSTFKIKVKPHCHRKFDQVRRKLVAPKWPSDGRRTKKMHYVLTYIWMNHVDGYTCIHRYEAVAGLWSLTLPKKEKKRKNAEILTPAFNEKEAHAESARHLAIITLQMCSEIDVSLRVALGILN